MGPTEATQPTGRTLAPGRFPDNITNMLTTSGRKFHVTGIIVTEGEVHEYLAAVRDTNPVHTNPELARKLFGFLATPLPGLMTVALVQSAFDSSLRSQGGESRPTGVLAFQKIRFPRALLPGEGGVYKFSVYTVCNWWRENSGTIHASLNFWAEEQGAPQNEPYVTGEIHIFFQ